MTNSRSDALVLFGVTGDLAHKMTFPALYAMAKKGALKVPLIGVALPKWSLERLHKRVTDSIERSGGIDNQRAEALCDSDPETGRANYLRFRLSPNATVALAARVKLAGKDFVGEQRELYLSDEQPGEEPPYERLLGDAMAGDGALFTREDAVEAARAVVDPVLKTHPRALPYKRRSWGPKGADAIVASDGGWHNPIPREAAG